MSPAIKLLLEQADAVRGPNSRLVAHLANAIRELVEAQFIDQRNNPRPKVEMRGRKRP